MKSKKMPMCPTKPAYKEPMRPNKPNATSSKGKMQDNRKSHKK